MKTIVFFAAFSAVALAAPQRTQRQIPSSNDIAVARETPLDNIGVDGYNFAYKLSDGQSRQESAQVEARGAEDAVLRVQGSYSWVNPEDGQTYTVTYVANENGFRPQGAHLPTVA